MAVQERHQEAAAAATGFVHDMAAHLALFFERSTDRLVVTFDNLESANAPVPHYPWEYGFVDRIGASHLGVMMAGPADWFRHSDVWAMFDGLQADGFFDRFAEVVFYGSSMGGYGALTFARAAPGCRIVALVPQTHLDPSVVPFETRYDDGFRQGDWSGSYLDAVDGARCAARVYVLYDPYFAPDARHVARLDKGNLVPLRLPWSIHHAGPVLRRTGQMQTVVRAAFDGDLTARGFRRTVRSADRSGMQARLVLRAGLDRGHTGLVARALAQLQTSHPDWSFPVLQDRARRALGQGAGR
ncbi:hypothetical protein [uncultured Tateyamaria sp.]|uniref:hypothetical protein n=1 Tax=uncultured Tateyamaria sp. TaxID=455651 RepID=UPI0026296017|nr:hypothetical protein [uncultured Tateyamaria sp.]